jgi:hypothetical protein
MDTKTKMLLVCGAMAGPVFTIAWLIEGLTRANYDPMRHPISALSLGESGWTQVANFVITGILTLCLAFGLWKALQSRGGSRWALILISFVAIGFLGTALFATDPLNSYPPGTPDILLPPTLIGSLHVFFAFFIFGLPVACFVLARYFDRQHERIWVTYSEASTITFIIVYMITIAGFLQAKGLVAYAGLLQRISLTVILAWMTVLPIYLLKHPAAPQAAGRN